MSGEKYVQITERQRDQFMASCRQVDNLKEVNANLQRSLEQSRSERQREEKANIARQQEFERSVANLSGNMAAIEQDFSIRLQQQRQQFTADLTRVGQNMTAQREEYLRLSDAQRRQFTAQLEQQRQELSKRIDAVAEQIRAREVGERARAEQWASYAEALFKGVAQGTRHGKFCPGALERLRSEAHLWQGSLRDGDFQAAMAGAQRSVSNLLQLRLELETLEAEWQATLAAARHDARTTLAHCDALTVSRLTFDTQQGNQEVDAEIDYWTEGGLTALRGMVLAQNQRLDQHAETLTLDELKRSIAQSQQWQDESKSLAELARRELVDSQLRAQISTTILESMRQKGWDVIESAYEGEDIDNKGWRNAYHMKLQNGAGQEMVTVITPERHGEQLTDRVVLSFFGQCNDETFNRQQSDAVRDGLRRAGVEVGDMQPVPGMERRTEGDRSRLDFKRVRSYRAESSKGSKRH
ncbi:MAG: hypothetical protein HQL80_10300 [Magnetococcales bacterium]|nr:hypothetical protein [Magnetococcales bacterium]